MKSRSFLMAGAAVVTACLCLAAASDSRTKSLSGVYAIGTINVDPSPDNPRDSHLIVYLQGDTAKDLYEAMKVAPKSEVCGPSGIQVKTIGGTSCGFDPESKSYVCDFAIDIAKQKVERLAC